MQPIRKLADRRFADVLNAQEVDDLFDCAAVADFLPLSRPPVKCVGEQAATHLERASRHEIVKRTHTLKERHVLESAPDALRGGLMGPHTAALLALEGDHALLRMIEAVYNVQHRGLARAIGADDCADFPFADVEADIVESLNAAKAQRDALLPRARPRQIDGLRLLFGATASATWTGWHVHSAASN